MEETRPKENNEKDFSNIKFLLSDWDGTLVDSVLNYTNSFAKTMSEFFHIPETVLKNYFSETAGQPLSHQITEAAQKFAHEIVGNTLEIEEKFWDSLQGTKPQVLEGAKEFLQEVKNKGIRIIVWSGTRTDVLRTNIELLGLSALVDFAIGNEPGSKEIVKGPGLLKLIAQNLHIPADELSQKSLVVGDGIGDIQAGKAIGAKTAGYTRIKNASLERSNPDFFFKSYSELLQKLKK